MVTKKQQKTFPGYKIHKASNRAYIWYDGKRRYLGTAESAESYEVYHRLIAELAQNQMKAGLNLDKFRNTQDADKSLLMVHVMAAFLTAHQETLSKGEFSQFRLAFRELRQLYGHSPAYDFGPRSLKTTRQAMVEAGLSRRVVNRRLYGSNSHVITRIESSMRKTVS